jgi:hypothetical protein
MNKELRILKKQIEKYYHLYGFMYQKLCVNTPEIIDDTASSLDVCLWDEKKKEFGPYLFEILNYNAFKNNFTPISSRQYFTEPAYRTIKTDDIVKASNSPLYMNRIYTLKKFITITTDDVIRCTHHFVNEVLDMCCIWNIYYADIEQSGSDNVN